MTDAYAFSELTDDEQRELLLLDAIDGYLQHAAEEQKHKEAKAAAQAIILRELEVGRERSGVRVAAGKRTFSARKAARVLTPEQYQRASELKLTQERARLTLPGVLFDACYEQGEPYVVQIRRPS